jgi:hypothetical protein
MLAVFGAPTLENLIVIPAKTDGKLEVIDVVTGLDLTEKGGIQFEVLGRAIKLLRNDSVEVEIFLSD